MNHMRLCQLFETDDPNRGAGCIFIASETKRLLFAHRARDVSQPSTFGTFGGSVKEGETPLEAMKREMFEETGYIGSFTTKPLGTYVAGDFVYTTFLVIVPQEFDPQLNHESQGFVWCEFGQWPTPLHPGLKTLLSDPSSVVLLTQKGLMKKDSVNTETPAVI